MGSHPPLPILEYRTTQTIAPDMSLLMQYMINGMAWVLPMLVAYDAWRRGVTFDQLLTVSYWMHVLPSLTGVSAAVGVNAYAYSRRQWTLLDDGISVENRAGERKAFIPWASIREVKVKAMSCFLVGGPWRHRMLVGLSRAQTDLIVAAFDKWRGDGRA
jgi:hypothetical protein